MRVQIQTGRYVSIAALAMGAACVYAQGPAPEKILPPTVEGSWFERTPMDRVTSET
jgi:hypothetical protein